MLSIGTARHRKKHQSRCDLNESMIKARTQNNTSQQSLPFFTLPCSYGLKVTRLLTAPIRLASALTAVRSTQDTCAYCYDLRLAPSRATRCITAMSPVALRVALRRGWPGLRCSQTFGFGRALGRGHSHGCSGRSHNGCARALCRRHAGACGCRAREVLLFLELHAAFCELQYFFKSPLAVLQVSDGILELCDAAGQQPGVPCLVQHRLRFFLEPTRRGHRRSLGLWQPRSLVLWQPQGCRRVGVRRRRACSGCHRLLGSSLHRTNAIPGLL